MFTFTICHSRVLISRFISSIDLYTSVTSIQLTDMSPPFHLHLLLDL